MVSLRFLLSASLSAFLVPLGACSSDPAASDHSAPTQAETGGSGGANQRETQGSTTAHAGAAGKRGVNAAGAVNAAGGEGGSDDLDSDKAGAAGENEATRPPCDLNGNCDSSCQNTPVTCGVQSGSECEYWGFVGATAQVTCGQRTVIGVACCGQCECVPVEIYFDGVTCWQGIPQCNNALAYPHSTTTPNPSFTPPAGLQGSYTLGPAGGGASASGGASSASAGASVQDAAGAAGAAAASDGGP